MSTSPEISEARIAKSHAAIRHALVQIRDYPEVGWYLGHCTQTFELLTAAYAENTGMSQDQVKEQFAPRACFDPRAKGQEEASKPSEPQFDDESAGNLAEDIVHDLMVNGERMKAQRLILVDRDGHDLGSWCRYALRNRIADHLLGKAVRP